MQITVVGIVSFQINRFRITVSYVKSGVIQRKRGHGLGAAAGFEGAPAVPVVGGLVFVLVSAEANGGSLNRDFAGVDDVVVNRRILVA